MIRHIVMWKLRHSGDAIQFKHLLESCKALVPGILEFDVGLRSGDLEATHDVVLVSTFANRDALEAYLSHPHHHSIAGVLGQMRVGRDVLDYDIEAGQHRDVVENPAFAPTVLQTPF